MPCRVRHLPPLRERVRRRRPGAPRATAAYARLIHALLVGGVQRQVDCWDPDISRHLVALFNFTQARNSPARNAPPVRHCSRDRLR